MRALTIPAVALAALLAGGCSTTAKSGGAGGGGSGSGIVSESDSGSSDGISDNSQSFQPVGARTVLSVIAGDAGADARMDAGLGLRSPLNINAAAGIRGGRAPIVPGGLRLQAGAAAAGGVNVPANGTVNTGSSAAGGALDSLRTTLPGLR